MNEMARTTTTITTTGGRNVTALIDSGNGFLNSVAGIYPGTRLVQTRDSA